MGIPAEKVTARIKRELIAVWHGNLYARDLFDGILISIVTIIIRECKEYDTPELKEWFKMVNLAQGRIELAESIKTEGRNLLETKLDLNYMIPNPLNIMDLVSSDDKLAELVTYIAGHVREMIVNRGAVPATIRVITLHNKLPALSIIYYFIKFREE